MKLGMHIMAPEPISTEYLRNPSHQSVSPYVYSLIVASQRLSKNITMTTHTIEKLLDTLFSMQSVSYERAVYGMVLN
jgi:hypothetical protein